MNLGNELTAWLGLPSSPSQGVLGARWDVGGAAQVPSGAAQLRSQVPAFGHTVYGFKDIL